MFKKENTQKKKVKLQVKEVYKIFGEKPEMALKHVLDIFALPHFQNRSIR